jgi:hypothetical protein
MTYDDELEVPTADHMEWYKCKSCEHLHIRMFGEHDELQYTAIIHLEALEDMLRTIRGEPDPHGGMKQ